MDPRRRLSSRQDEQRHAITAIERQLLRLVLDFRWGGLWPSRARNCLETKGKKWATNVAARRIAINGVCGSLSKPSCLRASGHLERCGHMRKPCNCGICTGRWPPQTSARAATLRPAQPPYERGCGQHQLGAATLRTGTAVAQFSRARTRAQAGRANGAPSGGSPRMRLRIMRFLSTVNRSRCSMSGTVRAGPSAAHHRPDSRSVRLAEDAPHAVQRVAGLRSVRRCTSPEGESRRDIPACASRGGNLDRDAIGELGCYFCLRQQRIGAAASGARLLLLIRHLRRLRADRAAPRPSPRPFARTCARYPEGEGARRLSRSRRPPVGSR